MESCDTTIDGSVRIPLYQPIEGWGPGKILRRAGFAAFGIDGTGTLPLSERWSRFVQELSPKSGSVLCISL